MLEEYVRMNYDGKGAKLYRVTRGGTAGEGLLMDGEPAIEEIDGRLLDFSRRLSELEAQRQNA